MKIRFVILLILSLLLAACASKEQKMSEELLKSSLKAPSTYKFISFEEESIETLGKELEGRIYLYESKVSTDNDMVEFYTSNLADTKEHIEDLQSYQKRFGGWEDSISSWKDILSDYEKELSEYDSKLKKDQEILNYLKHLYETEDLSTETGRIYALTYEAQNSFGVPLKSVFRTHFKSNGELVEYKSEDESWVPIGNVFSIPGYYELIGIE